MNGKFKPFAVSAVAVLLGACQNSPQEVQKHEVEIKPIKVQMDVNVHIVDDFEEKEKSD